MDHVPTLGHIVRSDDDFDYHGGGYLEWQGRSAVLCSMYPGHYLCLLDSLGWSSLLSVFCCTEVVNLSLQYCNFISGVLLKFTCVFKCLTNTPVNANKVDI